MRDVFVARQPIFNAKQKVFGYELLYRSCADNFYSAADCDMATSEVLATSFLLFGLEKITRGEKAFVNFTRKLLDDEAAMLLPNDLLVVELLEDVKPDDEVLQACRKLKYMGYLIALDDFTYGDHYEPFIKLADFIKIDFVKTDTAERDFLSRKLSSYGGKLIAEKVETVEDFNEAKKADYSYFQGYFFSRPDIFSGQDITGRKLNFMRLLQEVRKPEIDFQAVEEIIKHDPSLAYKLLRFINSLQFPFRVEIRSIRQALVLLGQKEVTKWALLIALQNIGEDKPDELITLAVHRARFCELLAPKIGKKEMDADLFLMGMFSLIDAFFDQPLPDLLEQLPISDNIKEGLLGKEGLLSDVCGLVTSYEKGQWDDSLAFAGRLCLDREDIMDCYLDSLQFANSVIWPGSRKKL